ncbi:MAG TPA: hypothetical protein VFG83_00630 [Kofleriaceae bacterium]|nr:hypothetical protein [Kofleriaceae bacterium]
MPLLAFGSPRGLPKPTTLSGRVVVLDIAFAASAGGGVSFATVTEPFIAGLGDRLAVWIDHHDHDRHIDFAGDPRFVLATKAEHGACPEMVTPDVVRHAGPIDTILCHLDLDGLYAAAKWILDGNEPYPGADDDARAIDTRLGTPSPVAAHIDFALRARFRDNALKRAVILWLVNGMEGDAHKALIDDAAAEFAVRLRGTEVLADRFVTVGRVAMVDAGVQPSPYDKTELLLRGQALAPVAAVRDSGMVTLAARFGSGWNFVTLLGLDGGMPTRVTIPAARLDEALALINAAAAPGL